MCPYFFIALTFVFHTHIIKKPSKLRKNQPIFWFKFVRMRILGILLLRPCEVLRTSSKDALFDSNLAEGRFSHETAQISSVQSD